VKTERLLEMESLIEEIIEEVESGSAVVVEGKKDRACLEGLGVPARGIVELNKGKNLAEAARDISARRVVLLTDSDRTGARLKKELHELLVSEGKKVNVEIRSQLRKLGVKHVEGLLRTYNELRGEQAHA